MPTAKICKFPPRTQLRDLCDGFTREDDEKLLRVLDKYDDEGRVSYAEDGSAVVDVGPQPYVSPYLQQPLRTEAEVRALREPRQPKVKGLLDLIAEQTGIDAAFRKLMGGA